MNKQHLEEIVDIAYETGVTPIEILKTYKLKNLDYLKRDLKLGKDNQEVSKTYANGERAMDVVRMYAIRKLGYEAKYVQ